MRSSISYTLRLFALLAAFVAASCVNDNEPDCPPIGQARQYVLNLRVVTSKAATRMTRAAGHGTEEATPAEDYIDIDGGDFLVLVFDGYGRLIQRFEPSSTVIKQGQGATYELSGVLGETSADKIQVAVIANCKSMVAGDAYDRFVLGNTFLSEMYSNGTKWNFTLPHPDGGWQPSKEAKRTIPMYGCSGVEPLGAATPSKDDENRYNLNLGEIKMLRAVAKIEVVDCLPEGVEIDPNVTLSAYNTQGRLIPDATKNPDWNVEGTQVISPTLPEGVTTAADLKFFTESESMTIGGKECNVYSAYVTEADLRANRPHIKLTVRDSGADPTSKDYQMAVDEYKEGKATNGLAALLRNHIYRYEIKSATSNTLTVNYTICPMGSGTADIPAFE